MTFEEIKLKISQQEIDTVLVCMVDMQGRLMGKRFHAEAFLEIAEDAKRTAAITFWLQI